MNESRPQSSPASRSCAETPRNSGDSHVSPRSRTLSGERFVLDGKSALFPPALANIPRPPKRLYIIGDPLALEEGLAVIGARKATPYGLGCARKFAGEAARRGIVIVSGGAYGCDAEAHRATLDAKGKTVVFLGGGCDRVYPARHFALFQEVIDKGGAVVSEHEWDFPPQPYTFRDRNRLIAGLSKATLIVEAGLPSGTFSTADDAINANKEVLVVPGPITSPTSAGTNRLLSQGAIPIVDDRSFEEALSWLFGLLKQEVAMMAPAVSDDELYNALRADPMRIEEMLDNGRGGGRRFGTLTELTIHLALLERQGLIKRFPDGRFGPAKI